MATEPSKPWYKSRMFWGTVILFVPKIVEAAGVIIPPFVEALIQAAGGAIGAVGARGAILRAGGIKGQ